MGFLQINYLVKSRIKRDWFNSTIDMLNNIIELSNSIQELPWPNYSVEVTREKVRLCNQYQMAAIRQIQQLENTIRSGCQWCLM
jgi:hypothetical protein